MDSTNSVTGTVERETTATHNGHVPTGGIAEPPRAAEHGQPVYDSLPVRATGTHEWYPYALAAVVVLGFFVLTVLLILRETSINEGHKDIVFMLFGGLVTGFSMVLSYFFGSSAGSAQKTAELAKIARSK
jgi:hypothetical protein